MLKRTGVAFGTVLTLVGCGGVSEERVGALEAQLKKLETQMTTPPAANTATDMTGRIDALEKSVGERFSKMEDIMDVLQRGVSQVAAPAAAQPVAALALDVGPDIDALVGIEIKGIDVSGDSYAVKRDWLMRELHAAALAGKGPKLSPAKPAGLAVKNVKPKSLIDQLGIKNGDLLLQVNDTTTNSVEELTAVLKKLGATTTVKLSRKKKDVTLTYTLKD